MAARTRIVAIQLSDLRFLLGTRLLRNDIHQVQVPALSQPVAILVGFREVVAGVEEQHRDVRNPRPQQVEQNHALYLEAACNAGRAVVVVQGLVNQFDRIQIFVRQYNRLSAHDSSPSGWPPVSRSSCRRSVGLLDSISCSSNTKAPPFAVARPVSNDSSIFNIADMAIAPVAHLRNTTYDNNQPVRCSKVPVPARNPLATCNLYFSTMNLRSRARQNEKRRQSVLRRRLNL